MLHNPCYIGKIRWSMGGERAVSKRDFKNEKILISDGKHDPLISTELWEEVREKLEAQKKAYPRYARREQPVEYMLKGLVRCSSCGATLAMSSTSSGKAKTRSLQCCNYSRGSCQTSHSILITKLNDAFVTALKGMLEMRQFTIVNQKPKPSVDSIDYTKLITVEERRLVRAKEAYLAEIDTIEQYSKNKKEITERIEYLKKKRDAETVQEIDTEAFADKVSKVIEYIEREDVTESAKNEALRTIIEKVVYEKPQSNLAIFFHM